jgi:hypothetical protein
VMRVAGGGAWGRQTARRDRRALARRGCGSARRWRSTRPTCGPTNHPVPALWQRLVLHQGDGQNAEVAATGKRIVPNATVRRSRVRATD